jgi:hypothetical protein
VATGHPPVAPPPPAHTRARTPRCRFLHWLGAFHGVELDFVFGAHQSGARDPTPEEHHLSAEAMRLWVEFITRQDHRIVGDTRGDTPPAKAWSLTPLNGSWWEGSGDAALTAPVHVSTWPLYNNVTHPCVSVQVRGSRQGGGGRKGEGSWCKLVRL